MNKTLWSQAIKKSLKQWSNGELSLYWSRDHLDHIYSWSFCNSCENCCSCSWRTATAVNTPFGVWGYVAGPHTVWNIKLRYNHPKQNKISLHKCIKGSYKKAKLLFSVTQPKERGTWQKAYSMWLLCPHIQT